jgi:SAM-dependent methyltransferase
MPEFDVYAGDYDAALNRGLSVSGEDKTFFAEQRVRWLARCLEKLAIVPKTVLDYGCGTGTATPYLINLLGAESVVGVDLSAKSLEVARQHHSGLPATYMLTSEYMPRGSIDLVFCNGVFHHIPMDERSECAAYIAKCLRPGGIFAMWENNPWSPAARFVMSRIPFDRDAVMVWPGEARRLATHAGLSVVRTDYAFVFPNVLRFLRHVEPSLSGLPLGAQYQVLSQKPANYAG